MKNKLFFSIFFFLLSTSDIYAQSNYYYYYKGQKVYLTLDKTFLNISAEESIQKSSIIPLNFKDFNFETDNSNIQTQRIAKLEFQNIPTDLEFLQKINSLKQNININNVSLYFKRTNAPSIGTSNYFYIKLKNNNDFSTLQQVASQKNVQIVKQVPNMPLWYILSLKKNTIGNSLDLTNYFYETGLFADVDPAFMFNFRNNCTNDTNFGNLWGLNNSASPNIDINACQAWNISQGSGIKVAVVDTGIDLVHNDLLSNIYPLSYDCQTQTSPSFLRPQNSWYYHGTHVAGTIGAVKDNNLQVVGVAPQSKLMSISHSLGLTPNISAELASGISWAYQNDADVINNSWGDPDPNGGNFGSAILENAIINAMILGRNNKGTVVVFATGNENGALRYPASVIPNVIAVGSITSNGSRSSFSNYGLLLDVVAPGSNIFSTLPNNQIGPDNGTSMASPHVTGLVALIISANPCLTGQQVRDIIEQTSQKVGGYSYTITAGRPNGTWNNQMGYGLIDAYAAVQMAQSMGSNFQISGNNTICNTASYSAPIGGISYNWTITQGASLVTLTGNGTANITLTALSNASGQVTLSLIMGGNCGNITTLPKTIWVGKPIVNLPTDCWNSIPTTPNCFSICRQFEMTTANYVFVEGRGLDDVSNQDNSWEWQKITNNFDLSPNGNSAYINPMWYGTPQNYLGYKVRVKNTCGWSEWFENYLDIIDCNNGGGQNFYAIFPNPSKDIVNIELKDDKNSPEKNTKISGELFDIKGLSKSKVQITDNKATFSVQGLNKGVYVLKIYINNQVETHELIVE